MQYRGRVDQEGVVTPYSAVRPSVVEAGSIWKES